MLTRNDAIRISKEILAGKDEYVIFDTETTGLGYSDVIIHMAVMDLNGNMLIDTFVNPKSKRSISPGAKAVNNISIKDLKQAPTFQEVYDQIVPISEHKQMITYNAQFHAYMIDQTVMNEGVKGMAKLDCIDIKPMYTAYSGLFNPGLPGRVNTGIGDCMATLALIKEMASSELIQEELPKVIERKSSSSKVFGWLFIILSFLFFAGNFAGLGFVFFIVGLIMIFNKNKKKK